MNRVSITSICLLVTLAILSDCPAQAKTTSQKTYLSFSGSDNVKVMTFNIRKPTTWDRWHSWKQRKEMVIDTLRSNAADIIGLQEAENDQVWDIQRAMPQYNNYAVGRNDGSRKGETCAIFYRKERFTVLDSGTFWFSNTPAVPGSKDWGNMWPRICSWVRLIDKTAGKNFYVYNIHLDNLSGNSRELSARLLAGKIAARKTRDPFIVMGDFNMEANDPAMQYLQDANNSTPYLHMRDAWSSVHFRERRIGTRHGWEGDTSGPMIDHIRLCENTIPLDVQVDRRQYDGRYPSDHFPVVAKIQFRSPTQITYKDTPKITPVTPKPGA